MDYSALLEEASLTNEDENYIEFGQIRIIQNFDSILVFIDYGVESPESFTSSSVEELVEELGRRLSINFTPPIDNYWKMSQLLEDGDCIIVTNYMSSIEIKVLGSSGANKCSIIIEDKTDLFTELNRL